MPTVQRQPNAALYVMNGFSHGEGWEKVEDDGFIGHVGPFWRKDDGKGGEIIGFIADDYHRNINGVVQGGMLMTLADRGMGRQVRHANGGKPVATVNFSYDFIGAGQIGIRPLALAPWTSPSLACSASYPRRACVRARASECHKL